jgi:hypothetical protein
MDQHTKMVSAWPQWQLGVVELRRRAAEPRRSYGETPPITMRTVGSWRSWWREQQAAPTLISLRVTSSSPCPLWARQPGGKLAVPLLARAGSGCVERRGLWWARPDLWASMSDLRQRIQRLHITTGKPFGVNAIFARLQERQMETCHEEQVPLLVLFCGDLVKSSTWTVGCPSWTQCSRSTLNEEEIQAVGERLGEGLDEELEHIRIQMRQLQEELVAGRGLHGAINVEPLKDVLHWPDGLHTTRGEAPEADGQ